MKPADERLRELAKVWLDFAGTDYSGDLGEGRRSEAMRCATELLSILNESPWQGSGEWKLMPVEPTLEMLAAAQATNGIKQLPRFSVLRTRYAAMIAAAPSIIHPPPKEV